MHRAGLSGMRARISETAKWGAISVGPKIIDESVKRRMKKALLDIQGGKFAKEWLRETAAGRKKYERLLKRGADQPIERVGDRLRSLMRWLDEKP
jgi:ketol-acid reductoisomerase